MQILLAMVFNLVLLFKFTSNHLINLFNDVGHSRILFCSSDLSDSTTFFSQALALGSCICIVLHLFVIYHKNVITYIQVC